MAPVIPHKPVEAESRSRISREWGGRMGCGRGVAANGYGPFSGGNGNFLKLARHGSSVHCEYSRNH